MTTRLLNRIAILSLLGGLLLLPSAGLAQTETGIGGRPTTPDPTNPRTSSIFVFEPKAGETVQSAVTVFNNSNRAATILVYAVDAEVASEGAFACKQQADPSIEVGKWSSVSVPEVSLAPGTTQVVPFSVSVPPSLSSGEYNGCIVIQEKRDPVPGGQGVALSFRSALRVAVTIPGPLEKKLDIIGLDVRKEKDKVILHPILQNQGNVSLDTDIKVRAKGLPLTKGYENGGTYPVLSRTKAEYNFEMKRSPWGGIYRGTVTAAYDPDTSHRLGVPGEKTASAQALRNWFIVWPVWWAALIELAVLAGMIALVYRRIKRRLALQHAQTDWLEYRVKSGETIQDIAARAAVSWKLIARINQIKPPYALAAGQTLKLPPDAVEIPGMIVGGKDLAPTGSLAAPVKPKRKPAARKAAAKKPATRKTVTKKPPTRKATTRSASPRRQAAKKRPPSRRSR